MRQEIFIKHRTQARVGHGEETLHFVRPKSEPGWGVWGLYLDIPPETLKQMRELLESPDAKG